MISSVIDDSLVKNNKGGFLSHVSATFEWEDLKEFTKLCLKYHVAPAEFKDNRKNQEHFEGITLLCYDFDDGTTHEEVKKKVKGIVPYTILASKNHLKDKGDGKGIIERFHLFILIEEPITDVEFYKYLWEKIKKTLELKDVDKSSVDPSRYYFKHSEFLSGSFKGNPIRIESYKKLWQNVKKYEQNREKAIQKKFENCKSPPLERLKKTKNWRENSVYLNQKGKRHTTAISIAGTAKKIGLPVNDYIIFILSTIHGLSNNEKNNLTKSIQNIYRK